MNPCRATSNTEISAIKMATSPSCLAYFKGKMPRVSYLQRLGNDVAHLSSF